MADSKANGLVKRVFASITDITGVRIWSQKDGEVDALGLEMSEMFSSDLVTDNSINYKALTPKGFFDNVATQTRNGITRQATPAEIDAGTAGNLMVIASELKRITDAIGIKLWLGGSLVGGGTFTKLRGPGDATTIRNSTGIYTVTHNLGTLDYKVIPNSLSLTVKVSGFLKNENYFQVYFTGLTGIPESVAWEFDMFTYTI